MATKRAAADVAASKQLATRVAQVLRGELPPEEALAVLGEVRAIPDERRTKDERLLVYRSRFAY